MTVTARMKCEKVTHQQFSRKVQLAPVYSNDKTSPNYSYSQATPSGDLTLEITNPEAFEQFIPGAVYDITINKYDQELN